MNTRPRVSAAIPLNAPTRVLARSDDAQIRLSYFANLEGVDVRLFRKSPSETDDLEAYAPTNAGLVIPRGQLREFLGLLAEILRDVEASA